MLSSATDKCAKQKGKKSAKKRKKCFVGDGRSRDLLVVDKETGCRLKEVFAHVVKDLLPKDPATDVQSDERVAGAEDERTEEKKERGDRNNQQGKKMHEVKKHFVLGVNEIVKSISRSSAIAVLLTDPLETHLQLQLQQLASHHSVPCICVTGFDETLKSLQVPSMVGIAVRPAAADPSSIAHPLLQCVKAAAGEADSRQSPPPPTRPVHKATNALQFREMRWEEVYATRDLVTRAGSGNRHDGTSATNEDDVIAVSGAGDNFFPCRTAVTSSPFVVSHFIQPPAGSDRDSAFMTRFSFMVSNMDQMRRPSSTADEGEEEKEVKFRQMTYRPADSLIVQPSGKKRIRHKNVAKKQQK